MKSNNYSDEKLDMHPKSWISRYRKTSVPYLIKMGLFYSAIGLVATFVVTEIEYFIYGYEESYPPVSLVTVLAAGPIEDTLFFGIPFYATGNHYVVLGTGIVWTLGHTLNTDADILLFDNLTYSNFAGVIPAFFFMLRTWISGKGWFSIIFHSSWNAGAFFLGYMTGVNPFMIFDTDFEMDVGFIILSGILLGITYPLYRWRIKREGRRKQDSRDYF